MGAFEVITKSEEETRGLGRRIGELLSGDEVILLFGELGTGKTTLVQGIAQGMGIKEITPSPSFVLIREYSGRARLYHVDLYRVGEDIDSIGIEECFGRGVVVVEWAERGEGFLPKNALIVKLEHMENDMRRIRMEAREERYKEIIERLRWNYR